jgi:predicted nucleic acid-binding protein
MRIDEVVVNASPLITLFRSGQAGLLPELFQKIIVPGSVWTEVTGGDRDDPAARGLIVQSWPV